MPNPTKSLDDTQSRDSTTTSAQSSAEVSSRVLERPTNNLPIQLSSFIGREREIAEVRRLLSESRLVTLTGPGGCGKTRLALQVAAELLPGFKDGVWFIELAPLADPALVPQAVAAVLGVREQPGQPLLNSLVDYLRAKDMLLVLDNCEHLIDACARFADALLHVCPNLRILATSREALDIAGEIAWTVLSLSLPDVRHQRATFTELSKYEAVQLFVDRAVTAQPGFKLTELNALAVTQVCQRLDGIPLAIELAAARVKVFKTAEIAARLDDRFSLLTTGSRMAVPRHQTLRAAIDWSYDLLTEPERVLLRRLAVFAGGCTLDAAEQVCRDENPPPSPLSKGGLGVEILDLLSHLVAKSLVIVDKQGGETRYRMLETIRQYARDKLLASGESGRVQNRHLEFYVKLAEDADARVQDDEKVIGFNRLELEHDNVRAALDWSRTAQGDSKEGLRLASALTNFWGIRGYLQEGREYLMALLAQNPTDATESRAKALDKAGWLSYMQGDYPAARAVLDASLALYRDLGPASRRGLAGALNTRGYMESEVGEYASASGLMLQSLDIMRELNDEWGIALVLRDLGACAIRAGDYGQASRYLEQALPLWQRIGDSRDTAIVLTSFAEIALRQANYERAAMLEQESLMMRRKVGDKWGIAVSLGNLAWALLKRGDLEQAVPLLAESITLRQTIGDPGGIAWCLEKLAEIALTNGQRESTPQRDKDFRRAARLFGAAAALRAPIGSVIDLADMPEHERQLAVVRGQLGDEAFETLRDEGRALTLEQAIEYALEATPQPREHAGLPLTPRQKAKQEFGGLTERERDVAARIAQGESNREIAEELVVSERTVESHVANILNKLGFTTRAQIRKWAIEKGFVKRDK